MFIILFYFNFLILLLSHMEQVSRFEKSWRESPLTL